MVLFFILEEIESSLWSPYLQILPITFTTLAAAGAELDISYLPLNARTLWEKQSNEMKMMFNKVRNFSNLLYFCQYRLELGTHLSYLIYPSSDYFFEMASDC